MLTSKDRFEASNQIIQQQNELIENFVKNEKQLTQALNEKKVSESKLIMECNVFRDKEVESQQYVQVAEKSLETNKKRNMELQARCDELGKKLEAERKLRYVYVDKYRCVYMTCVC